MTTVRDLLKLKHSETNFSVAGNDTVFKALEVLERNNISALLVSEGDKIVGIFTERDYTRKGELLGRTAKDTVVKELMTEQMVTVTPETSMDKCIGLMLKYRIRHLPVIVNDHLAGLVSMRDVVEIVLSDKEDAIKGLENYILGTGFDR
jgi:CBS domain-containing protein